MMHTINSTRAAIIITAPAAVPPTIPIEQTRSVQNTHYEPDLVSLVHNLTQEAHKRSWRN